ncbi:60S ribosomal protein eL27 [Magnusiomyces paraingens]|uniref:60S ribosomal protein L27 n=1 Tax=Magnusiomyces paraingens TaxID=2606893 RepID=A0A5E8BH42_9ASCO|nr:uncharacterized protein SAPINGB_P001966 [Saprochaete ingens]VVT48817.1 unnamed protein product [Saprochaete ingens]
MGSKFLKPGKVAIIVRGRYAGKKVVIIKSQDDGSKSHPFGYALVAGIEKHPQKVNKSHNEKQAAKRNEIKPFIKLVNYNHIMPTRYTFELDNLKTVISEETFDEGASQREEAKTTIKKAFEEKHQAGKNTWFFTQLRF